MSLRRLLVGLVTLTLGLVVLAGTASAKTVYDYVYSGTYIDGSGAGKTFDTSVSGLDLDRKNQVLYVANGGEPGYLTKVTLGGAGVNFSATGSPRVPLSWIYGSLSNLQVALDQYGGPNDGNVYVSSGSFLNPYRPDGTPLPGFDPFFSACGVRAEYPLGEELLAFGEKGPFGGETSIRRFSVTGERLPNHGVVGEPGMEPGTKIPAQRGPCFSTVDGEGLIYGVKSLFGGQQGRIFKITRDGTELYEVNGDEGSRATAVDHSNNDVFIVGESNTFEAYDKEGRKLGYGFGAASGGYEGLAGSPEGIVVDPVTHDVWVANQRSYGGIGRVEKFERTNPHIIPDSTAIKPDYSHPTGATIGLRGIVNPDGVATTDCHFEYGPTQSLGSSAPCGEGNVLTGSTDQEVTSGPIAFAKGARYYYKLSVKNGNNQVATSNTQAFIPQGAPIVHLGFVDRVKTDGARFGAEFDTNGGNASFHVEYGVAGGALDQTSPESDTHGFTTTSGEFPQNFYEPGIYTDSITVSQLKPGTDYEYRVVVSNEGATVKTPIQKFSTYPPDAGTDPCPNSLTRRQTGSALLLDCRGYELVSAQNAGGYDVESDIVAGLEPLTAYPRADDRALYSVHFGVVPGVSGSPTNLALDPYVASRGADGWHTEYVGLPSDGMADPGAFGSPLLGADPELREFAFDGESICDPCFADGSSNIPLRKANGELIKGMAGSLSPAADPTQTVLEPFSADGNHFVFGSDGQFEPNGSAGGSIYDRNLVTGTTQVVSTTPAGSALAGGNLTALDISADGSRIVIGQKVGADAKGNELRHLYMHIGTTAGSVDLTPGATAGALFAGMSADGQRVFLSTKDKLLGADTDTSTDVYEAAVPGGGPISLRLVSTEAGTASNDDGCTPPGAPDSWNSPAGAGKCDAVSFAGSAGSAADGTLFFVSPEQLDAAEGVADQPNLYFVEPGGDPQFVATLSTDSPAVEHGVQQHDVHSYADFQVSPDGRFAAFASDLPLTGFPSFGNSHIYRYDAGADSLACASCAVTHSSTLEDTFLSPHGLNLTDDGRVFYTTLESLALRDTNEKTDVYEWNAGEIQLISTGIAPDDSGLVTVSADGKNAFFFTREVLSHKDENGNAIKIYTAREGGGFVNDPDRKGCAASDECHGPGTVVPPPPAINTISPTTVRKATPCKKGQVRKNGSCVKKAKKKKKKQRKRARRGQRRTGHGNG